MNLFLVRPLELYFTKNLNTIHCNAVPNMYKYSKFDNSWHAQLFSLREKAVGLLWITVCNVIMSTRTVFSFIWLILLISCAHGKRLVEYFLKIIVCLVFLQRQFVRSSVNSEKKCLLNAHFAQQICFNTVALFRYFGFKY